jgi:hypothetical protein
LLTLVAISVPTNAQLGAGAQTSVADCRAFTTSSTVAVVDAGSIVFCSRSESRVSTSAAGWRLGASLTTPRLSGASPSIAITLNALSGCTAGTPVVTGTAAAATFGAQTSSSWMMTMTGGQCSGYLRGTVVSGGTTVYDGVLDFGVMSADTPNYNVNSGGITVTDDANGWATNTAITSWPTLTTTATTPGYTANGGMQQYVHTNGARLAFSPFFLHWPNYGTMAVDMVAQAHLSSITFGYQMRVTWATVTLAGSGCALVSANTQSALVAAPDGSANANVLNRLTATSPNTVCQVTGTVSYTDSTGTGQGPAFRFQSIVSTDDDGLTVANTVSGGLTVTDDADGWAIHQDEACGATITCQSDTNSTVNIGNAMVNQTSQLSVALSNPVSDFWFPLLFWLAALMFCLYHQWWLSAGFCLPGLLNAILPNVAPVTFAECFVLALLGLVLEVAAHRFQFGYWSRRTTTGA